MSPGDRVASGRREPVRPQYGATAPGFPPYYPNYVVPHHNAWLGAPLISMANMSPPSRHTPISKLAVHAQGAPLIIQNRYDRRKFTNALDSRNNNRTDLVNRCEIPEGNRQRNQQQQTRTRGGRNNNTDAVSVASDESSGSNNSETMLPRIIKPRKRRKKDRKPNNIVGHELNSASIELAGTEHSGSLHASNSPGGYDNYLPYRLNVKVLEYPDPNVENYRVSALGEALEATRFGLAEAASPSESASSSCQCRYCDPVGQIWDADSIADLLNENSSIDFAPTKLEDSMKVVGPMGRRGADTMLRRSWSDPSSRAPERINVNGEILSAPNLYSLFPPTRRASSTQEPRSPLALEISSEIVTSINGHRDLEIKLFSSTAPVSSTNRCSFFADISAKTGEECENQTNNANSGVDSEKFDVSVTKDSKEGSENVAIKIHPTTSVVVGSS